MKRKYIEFINPTDCANQNTFSTCLRHEKYLRKLLPNEKYLSRRLPNSASNSGFLIRWVT